MIDTFHPLYLTPEVAKLDDENYLYSWFEESERLSRPRKRTMFEWITDPAEAEKEKLLTR